MNTIRQWGISKVVWIPKQNQVAHEVISVEVVRYISKGNIIIIT